MRIDAIDLVRYGHFSNYSITIPQRQPDYFVIYGQNEAGKSTLLRGISALLFGVPPRTPDVHSCKGSELRIGGTISGAEKRFSFRRRKGVAGTLLGEDDQQIPEDRLGLFLRGLDRTQFEQFFGLDHLRLREGGEELLRGKGDVGNSLFQAAGLDLRKILEGLASEAKELFSPKSKSRVIGSAMEEYRQARAELRRISLTAGALKEKRDELDRARKSNENLNAEAESLRQSLTKLNRIAGNKPDVARLQELRATLATLDSVPNLPASARSHRDEAAYTLSEANRQIEALTTKIQQCTERMSTLSLDIRLKTYAPKIEELNAGVQDYLRAMSDRPKREADYEEAVRLAENEWREVWNKLPVAEAEKLRTTYARKAEIRSLMTEHARLSTAFEQSEQALLLAQLNHERLSRELLSHPEPPDPIALIAAVDQAKGLGNTDEAIARIEGEINRLKGSTSRRDLKALPLWSRTIEDLELLQVPMLSTVEQYSINWEALAAEEQEIGRKLSTENAGILEKQAELERLGTQIKTVSESELNEERSRRDQVWGLIRRSTFDGSITAEDAQQQSGSSLPLPELFVQHLRRADEIADLRFSNARDVAIHDRLVKEIDLARDKQKRAEAELQELRLKENELKEKWIVEWKALQCDPVSPLEMKEWMQRRQNILERLDNLHAKENELLSLQERTKAAGAEVRARLKDLGHEELGEDDSLAVLLNVARKFAEETESQRRAIREIRRDLRSINVESLQAKLADCKEKLSEWSRRWSPFIGALFLPESSTPADAGEALDVLEKVFLHLKDAHSFTHRINRITENITAFETSAGTLTEAIDTSLGSLSPDQAAVRLHTRLVENGQAETARREMELQNAADEKALEECRASAEVAAKSLAKLMEVAKCSEDQDLEAVITSAEEKAAKKDDYDRISAALIARNGISDLNQIEEEASSYELDALHGEIGRLQEREQALRSEVFQAGTECGRLEREFEQLENSEQAAFQAQKAEDALAKARPAIAQYLRLRIAAEVLQRAMDSYREKHQGPVLSRASGLFSRLTLGEHVGLTTGFGDDDKPVLVAIRNSKEQVEVSGLSDGTRDQLYLSLRLAAIEHHVKTVGPCPVILDDILINSDDGRASAALDVLGELASQTQVLLFTHHSHVADMGTKAGAQLIELGSRFSTASA